MPQYAGRCRTDPGTLRQIHKENTKFTLVLQILSFIEKYVWYWLTAWHRAVPGHQQIPIWLKYKQIKENLQVHGTFRLSKVLSNLIHAGNKATSIK